MSAQQIGVGMIGASPDSGWAAYAHLPALAALPRFKLQAVSTTRQESADAAARAFGASHAFSNHQDLVRCPDVDLVVVTVKVPHHRELVAAAIEAGKDVYCEWPLGLNEHEAEELTQQAARAGVRTVIGLQSRMAPAINAARDIIAAGELGDILSTTMIGTVNPGATTDPRNAYLADRASGANAMTISGGHSIDALCYALGEFEELKAVLKTRVPILSVNGSDKQVSKTAPDQIAVIGTLAKGIVASVHLREGLNGASEFLWEINGTTGTLQLKAPNAHPGFYPLSLTRTTEDGSESPVDVDLAYGASAEAAAAISAMGDSPVANVARLYDRYANDVMNGTKSAPDFTVAVARHKMIGAMEASAG